MPPENVSKRFKASSAGQLVDRWKRSNKTLVFDGVAKNYTLCTIEFFLPEDLQPPVLYYYRLTNFHQNHRQYILSRHEDQLKGSPSSLSSVRGSDCSPVGTQKSEDGTEERIVYPCGMIANSYFNDTFATPLRLSDTDCSNLTQSYNMTSEGIANPIDKLLYQPSRYEIPSRGSGNKSVRIVPPPAWAERFPNGYHSENMFNPAEDESFMVWMRTAAGSTFAKPAMRNDHEVMERGMYRLETVSRKLDDSESSPVELNHFHSRSMQIFPLTLTRVPSPSSSLRPPSWGGAMLLLGEALSYWGHFLSWPLSCLR